jgi:hypothetical protein
VHDFFVTHPKPYHGEDLPYDPERDFIYLTLVSGTGGPVVAAKKTGATRIH